MNPLSPITYYRRHVRSALLFLAFISLMTLGVGVMVRLVDSIWEELYNAQRYVTRLSLVSASSPTLDAGAVAQIRAHPDVAHVIQAKSLDMGLPQLMNSFHLFGVSEADTQTLMDICGLRLREGRLPRARTNEMLLSREIALAMGIQIGDQIDRSIGETWTGDNFYEAIPVPLKLVGILEGADAGPEPHIRMGLVSYEYVSSHELFEAPWAHGLLVIAREGHKETVDAFLESEITSARTDVLTHGRLISRHRNISAIFHVIFGIVDVVVATVIALVVGITNQIAQAKRLEEFGLLHAVGYSRRRLIRRLTAEMAAIATLGWLVGLALSWAAFGWLDASLYEPRGMTLALGNLTPVWFSLPIPLAATILAALNTRRTFTRLDAVAIVERGKLSTETDTLSQRRKVRRSSTRPLSSWTFYRRHRRRGLALVATMALMILGVSFPVFVFAPMTGAMTGFAAPLRQVGIVSPRMGRSVAPGLVAQIRSHPGVARVIPSFEVPVRVVLPPFWGWPISVYGVTQDDMQTLVELYDIRVQEGRLPRPRSNEIALSEGIARNRGLHVGSRIGYGIDETDDHIPTEMVIVGILSRASPGPDQDDLWLGLASYEYLSSHERYTSWPISLLVVPAEGRYAELETWLQDHMDTDQTEAETFEWMLGNYRILTLVFVALFGIVEGVIAIVAAIALAVLSYIYFMQRRQEFGILHAIGHSRWRLVLRTAKESISVAGAAWLIGATVCMAGLVLIQLGLYAPRGLSLDFFSPAPWLFTLPLPLIVTAVSVGLIAWMLSRLYPVEIIERR
jgi:ABC-type lipoprotein release transport system permease subunit